MSSQQWLSEDSTVTFNNFIIIPFQIRETFFGKIRAFSTLTTCEWLYLTISVLGLITSLGISFVRIVTLPTESTEFTFALYYSLTFVFCLYYVIHAVLTERPDELFVFVACSLIAASYCVIDCVEGTTNNLKWAQLGSVSLMGGLLVRSGLRMAARYCKSKCFTFYAVGGSAELHSACRMYFFCSTLLKFDLQLQLSMLIMMRGSVGRSINQTENIIFAVGIPISLVFFALGFVGLRRENRIVMAIFFILGLWEPGYVAYEFVHAHKRDISKNIYGVNISCGIIVLLVWAILVICTAYFIKEYFSKGLKEKMFGQVQTGAIQEPTSTSRPAEESSSPSTQATELPAAEDVIHSPLHLYFP